MTTGRTSITDFAREAAEAIERSIPRYRGCGMLRDAAALEPFVRQLRSKPCYVLPRNGVYVDGGKNLIPGAHLARMPETSINLEIPYDRGAPADGDTPSTRRVVLIREAAIADDPGNLGMRRYSEDVPPTGIVVVVAAYYDDMRTWIVQPAGAFMPYDLEVAANDGTHHLDPSSRTGGMVGNGIHAELIPVLPDAHQDIVRLHGPRIAHKHGMDNLISELRTVQEFLTVLSMDGIDTIHHEPRRPSAAARATGRRFRRTPYRTLSWPPSIAGQV